MKKTLITIAIIILFLNLNMMHPKAVLIDFGDELNISEETLDGEENITSEQLLSEIYSELELGELEHLLQKNNLNLPYTNLFDFLKAIFSGEYRFDFSSFLKTLGEILFQNFIGQKNFIITILVLCLLSTLLSNISASYFTSKIGDISFYSIYMLMCICLFKVFFEGIEISSELLTSLIGVMNIFLPTLTVLLCTNGGVLSSALLSPTLTLATTVISQIITKLLIPITSFAFILSSAERLMENIDLSYMTGFIKKTVLFVLGLGSIFFIGIISIEGLSFASIDGIGAKTLKYATQNLIPIAGSFLSSSIDSISGFLLIIKNGIGLISVLIILGLTLTPIIKIFVIFLMIKLCAITMQPICDKRLSGALNDASSYILIINGAMITVCIMFIVMVSLVVHFANYILMLR